MRCYRNQGTMHLLLSSLPTLLVVILSISKSLFQSMKAEWQLVLHCESTASAQSVLHQHCPHVRWQPYREVMTMVESAKSASDESLLSFLKCYNPPVQSSANCEDISAQLQDSVQRSGKSDAGSITNLASVAIRGVHKKAESTEEVQTVVLRSEDFEGNQVRALKSSIFRPESCAARSLVSTSKLHLILLKVSHVSTTDIPVLISYPAIDWKLK